MPNPSTQIPNIPHPTNLQLDFEHATLNSAIFSLTLRHGSVPPMPFNSPASSPDHPYPQNPNPNPHAYNPHNPNLLDNPSSVLQSS